MKKSVIKQIEIPKSKEQVAKPIIEAVESLIRFATIQDLEQLHQDIQPQVITEEDKALAQKIAGLDYSEGNLLQLKLTNLEKYYQRRRQLLADSITTTQVVKLIGCQAITTVHDRRKASTLIGLKDNGVYKFPLWQFDPEGDDGVIDGLPDLLKTLQISNFAKLNWLSKPLRAFNNQTPIEILKSGNTEDLEDLMVEARAVGVAQ